MEFIREFINYNQYGLPTFLIAMIIIFVLMWLAVVVWVSRDITTRTRNILVIIFSIVIVGLTNLFGLVVYILIRPSQTLLEQQQHDLFYHSVLDKEITSCAHCNSLVRNNYHHCPICGHALENNCKHCGEQLNPAWNYCVACGKPTVEENNSGLGVRVRNWANHLVSFPRQLFARVRSLRPKIIFSFPRLRLPRLNRKPAPAIAAKAETVREKSTPAEKKIKRTKEKLANASTSEMADANLQAPITEAVSAATVPTEGQTPSSTIKLNKDGTPRKPRADAGRARGKYKARNK